MSGVIPSSSAIIDLLSSLVDGDRHASSYSEVEAWIGTSEGKQSFAQVLGRLQGEFARLRRREHELTVLFSSARELAESRDVDTLLARLVSRAHELMGTDVTYLSVFDPNSRELHVRKTVGAVTPQFQNLRVPPDKGLASGIAASRTAQWTQSYRDYAGDPHDHDIDDAVTAEGIVSILGVPMLAEDEVLGVLFAATRREHAFTPEETALLSALADHASVVMQTAEILKQLRKSEDETRQAFARLSEHVEARDRSNVVHQQLIQAVLTGEGFPAVAATIAQALVRSVRILDDAGHVHAQAQAQGPAAVDAENWLTSQVRAALDTSRATGHSCGVEGDPTVEAVAAITVGAEYYGAVLLSHGDLALGPVDQRTIERAAQVCSLLTLQQNAADDADRRTRGELVADLLDSAPERRRDLARRLRTHGMTFGDLNAVVAIVVGPDLRSTATRHLARTRGHGMLVADVGSAIVLVGTSDKPVDVADDIRTELARALGTQVLAIAPPPSRGPDDLPSAFLAVTRTQRILAALQVDDATVDTDEYELFGILFAHDPHALQRFVTTTIGAVLDYDDAHNTDLTATLRAFVRHDASPTKTARALNYHPNTILQRLERLRKLLGDDWRTDQRLYRISTAVRLDELRSAGTGDADAGGGRYP